MCSITLWLILLIDLKRGNAQKGLWAHLAALFSIFDRFSWNFQQMLDLGFSETSQSFSSSFFHSFQGGTQGKMLKNCQNYTFVFEFFPLETIKKSCLKALKFWEVSENPKSSICWKFQLSISKTVGCPHFCMVNISNWGSPFLRISPLAYKMFFDWNDARKIASEIIWPFGFLIDYLN